MHQAASCFSSEDEPVEAGNDRQATDYILAQPIEWSIDDAMYAANEAGCLLLAAHALTERIADTYGVPPFAIEMLRKLGTVVRTAEAKVQESMKLMTGVEDDLAKASRSEAA